MPHKQIFAGTVVSQDSENQVRIRCVTDGSFESEVVDVRAPCSCLNISIRFDARYSDTRKLKEPVVSCDSLFKDMTFVVVIAGLIVDPVSFGGKVEQMDFVTAHD